jgi:DNA polymerase-3 subunit gamma/tau
VIEIDGASNNGVDAIRELREGVVFMPSSGKYKVYIIDEVHMLSTSAFNALLKTLEEPPDHVIFIMATTEVQKIPQTILSRCQRFDFRRIPTRTIVDRMSFICKEESIPADEEALWTVARQGDGSMRDALSLLDQVITFSNGPLVASAVIEILGLTERSLLTGVLGSLISRQSQDILRSLEKLASSGTEPHLFLTDLLELIRATLLVKISGEQKPAMLDLPDSELRFLKDLSSTCSEEDLHLLFDMSIKGLQDLQKSSEPRIVLEMILLRMSAAPRIVELKRLLSSEGQTQAPTSGSAPKRVLPPNQPPPAAAKVSRAALTPSEKWFEFVQTIKSDEPLMGAKVENLLFIGEANKVLELAIPQKMGFLKDQMSDPALRKKLQNMIETSWGPGYALEIKQEDKKAEGALSASGLGQVKEKLKEDDLLKQATEHPKVKSATSVFKGSIQLKDADKAKERS